MTHCWRRWPSLRRRLAAAERLLLLLDYDGTVVPLVDHPSKARLSRRARRLLDELSRRPGSSVAIISGRALRDLRRMVGVRRLCYAGNHGLEFQGDGLRYLHPVARASRPLLARIARELAAALRRIPGAWVEDKRLTVSLHWRRVPRPAQRDFHRTVARLVAPDVTRRRIRLTRGKRVIEMRPPVRWGKGELITWLLRRRGGRALLVYLGDDETDEGAFRVVNRARGLSIVVGSRRHASAAAWYLRSPAEVHELLTRISAAR